METCPNHPHRKVKAKGLCGSCYDKQLKANNAEYHAAQKANASKWMRMNPDKRKAYNKKRKEEYYATAAKDPEGYALARRESMLQSKYKIGNADYEKMLIAQNGGCAICERKPAEKKYLHVDHCHRTGKVRGLLCHQCNWYLGTIDADPKILERIYEYRKQT